MSAGAEKPKNSKTKSLIIIILSSLIALIYGISPLDVVPDAAVPVGFADDLVVAIAALLQVWRQIKNLKAPLPQSNEPKDEQTTHS